MAASTVLVCKLGLVHSLSTRRLRILECKRRMADGRDRSLLRLDAATLGASEELSNCSCRSAYRTQRRQSVPSERRKSRSVAETEPTAVGQNSGPTAFPATQQPRAFQASRASF
ncbi:hypothetical protein L1887_54888 [Cichorium endivia]|nr:hypothetical protein L1887_54888 [Cichorium endivia]